MIAEGRGEYMLTVHPPMAAPRAERQRSGWFGLRPCPLAKLHAAVLATQSPDVERSGGG